MPTWGWIVVGLLIVLALIAGTVVVTVAATSRPQTTATRPATTSTSTTPLPAGSIYMPDFRGQTAQTAANILYGQLGDSTSVMAPGGAAAANDIVTSTVPTPGTVVNSSTTIQLYTAGSSTSSSSSGSSSASSTPTGTFSAGTYEVGAEIQPGTYKTAGSSSYCYYARLKSPDGELSSIITNDNVQGAGVMTVKASDKYIEFSGSCTWTKQ